MKRVTGIEPRRLLRHLASILVFISASAYFAPSGASAQDGTQALMERVNTLIDVRDWMVETRRKLRQERKQQERSRDSSEKSAVDEVVPAELRQPWVFQSTRKRRAVAEQWPEEYAKDRKEMAKAGPDYFKIPWFQHVSAEYAAREELVVKDYWLGRLSTDILREKAERLANAKGAVKAVLEKEIRHEIELAERLTCSIISCSWPTAESKNKQSSPKIIQPRLPGDISQAKGVALGGTAAQSNSPAKGKPEKPKLKMLTGFASGILQQMGLHHERLDFEAQNASVKQKIAAAERAAGDGKAGGGGVSLHLPATIKGPLDPKTIKRAFVADDRLVLETRDGDRIRMPEAPLDDLAVAIRAIFGPKSLLEGELIAVDGEAIVFKTGPNQFGDVVWRKAYLPQPWSSAKPGQTVGLAIAPAVGIMPLPRPSLSRITYYGDIKNTRLGRVISDADRLLNLFMNGTHDETGKLTRLADVPGFMTSIEIAARQRAGQIALPAPKEKKAVSGPYKNPWWRGGTFFVWSTAKAEFRYDPERKEIIPIAVSMRLDNWTANPKGPPPHYLALADFVTRNFEKITKHYPVLGEMREIAATVALVRWLKVNNVPVDLNWARSHKVVGVETPERQKDVLVILVNDRNGKPTFRKQGRKQGRKQNRQEGAKK